MIPLARRKFMQLLGVTSVSMPRGMATLPAMLGDPMVAAAVGATASASGVPPSLGNGVADLFRRQVEALKRDVEDEMWTRRAVRECLDGDIQSMRSVSLVNKQRMQIDRDTAYRSLIRKAEETLWPR